MEDRLYKFAQLVESQSFTKAAAKIHISQPALTAAIQKLERELHAELLVRASHTFTLTTAGHIAYRAAKELDVHTRNLKLRLLETANEKIALNLGMIDSIADLLFVHGDSLHDLEQGTRLSLTVNNSSQLIKQVAANELDVALIAEPQHLPGSLTARLLAEEPLILVTSSDNRPAVSKELVQKHISHFLGYNQNSQTSRLVERYFLDHDIALQTTFYSTSPEIMLQLVLSGRGTAVLPYLLVKPHLTTGALTVINVGKSYGVSRRIMSLHRTGRTIPTSVQQLFTTAAHALKQLHTEAATIAAKTKQQ